MLPGHLAEGGGEAGVPGDADRPEGGGGLLDRRRSRRQENLNGVPEGHGNEPPQMVLVLSQQLPDSHDRLAEQV